MDTQKRPENPAKTYLKRYRALVRQQESLLRSIESVYDRAYNITATLKAVNVQSSGTKDRIADDVAWIIDETERLREMQRKVEQAAREVLSAIEAVPDEMQRTVLTLRYVEGLDWIAISERIHYEERMTFILHGRALWAVKKWLEKRVQENAV